MEPQYFIASVNLTGAFVFIILKSVREIYYMFDSFKEDINSFMEHDPAARSPIEIVLLYPGFKALQSHKRAKWFLNHNMPL